MIIYDHLRSFDGNGISTYGRYTYMVKHIVMWKIKDGEGNMTKAEIMAKIVADLTDLKDRIPEIVDLEVGASLTGGDMHYDMALAVTFKRLDDVMVYAQHPDHVKVSDFIAKVRTDRVVADIEV